MKSNPINACISPYTDKIVTLYESEIILISYTHYVNFDNLLMEETLDKPTQSTRTNVCESCLFCQTDCHGLKSSSSLEQVQYRKVSETVFYKPTRGAKY